MERGDYITFKVDWEANTLEVGEIGPVLRQHCSPCAKKIFEITPFMRAIECLSRLNHESGPPFHFMVDMRYDRKTIVAHVHCTDDFASVVDVPRERLRELLGTLLTPRETQIATLLFEGSTIRYIATILHIAEGTVKRIIYNLYRKLGVSSQVELVREIYTRLAQLDSF